MAPLRPGEARARSRTRGVVTLALGFAAAAVAAQAGSRAFVGAFARGAGRLSQIGRRQAASSDPVGAFPQGFAEAYVSNHSSADQAASDEAYELWRDQFPIAAARRDYFGLPSSRVDVQARMLYLAEQLQMSTSDALDIFRQDLWVLSEPSNKTAEKLEAIRGLADTEGEVVDFLRAAPRAIATTSVKEIQKRGLLDMRTRAFVGSVYELLISPVRLLIKMSMVNSAREIEASMSEECDEECARREAASRRSDALQTGTYVFFGSLVGALLWVSYMDATAGGPVHGKGLCVPAGFVPAYNIPDAEGNARLPCSCAPIYKWYLEPRMGAAQKQDMAGAAPKVDSKNCGRNLLAGKKECDPTTAGGCVWTASDLEKDPSYWDAPAAGEQAKTYWEKQRAAKR